MTGPTDLVATLARAPAGLVTPPEWMPSWLAAVVDHIPLSVVRFFQSLALLALAYVVSRFVVQLVGRRVARRFKRPSLTRTVLRGIRVGIFLFAFLSIMGVYGLELGDIALSVTVFTAVVGVVLAPIVGSVISGVFLLADQPYEIGDMIEFADNGRRGFVEDITLRYTKVFTLDNTFVVVPNGTMRERDVVNYSAEDSRTRQSLQVLVTYESDIQRARELIEQAARDTDGVIEGGPQIRIGAARYPAAPTCYIDEYADHGVLLTLRHWVEEPYWLLRTRSNIQTRLAESMASEPVEIAYPHQHHVFDETSGQMQVRMQESGTVGYEPPGSPSPERSESPSPESSGGQGTPEDSDHGA